MANLNDGVRAYRAVRLMYRGAQVAMKHGIGNVGSKMALQVVGKANLIVAVADAAISVAGAFRAYFKLQEVREETIQLTIVLEMEEEKLKSETEQLRLKIQQQKESLEDKRRVLVLAEKARERSFKILDQVRLGLDQLREDSLDESSVSEAAQKFQNLCSMYERAAHEYKSLTDEIYG